VAARVVCSASLMCLQRMGPRSGIQIAYKVAVVMGTEGYALWDTIRAVALEEGVELFDIELPSDTRRGGVLRVYITKNVSSQQPVEVADGEDEEGGAVRGGISFEDCVRVSKRLLDMDEQQELIPPNCTLEVSSPGINRKLRLPEHFAGAVGERVRVKFRDPETGATLVMHGHIRGSDGRVVTVENEAKKGDVTIALQDVKEARVDFKF
jgi:ribosome maturation factor RimP